jgi:acetyltransferase-like isoleucine patch superfamily enzyme
MNDEKTSKRLDKVTMGKDCRIGENLRILGDGEITFGNNVAIGNNVVINVAETLVIGDRSIIGDHFIMEGRKIEIGTEFWSGHHCHVGGGSCFEKPSKLKVGYWVHLGNYGMINTARAVTIGDEVGMGIETKIYTHGAYLSAIDGFPAEFGPVELGSHVWLPYAIIMPNVHIGDNVVVGAGAVVTKDLPSGCLAVGMPAKVIKENCYPKKYTRHELKQIVEGFIKHFVNDVENATMSYREVDNEIWLLNERGDWVRYSLSERQVFGQPTALSERFRNELRRHGVRFKSYPEDNEYKQW